MEEQPGYRGATRNRGECSGYSGSVGKEEHPRYRGSGQDTGEQLQKRKRSLDTKRALPTKA